jgi:hypothetical protein
MTVRQQLAAWTKCRFVGVSVVVGPAKELQTTAKCYM